MKNAEIQEAFESFAKAQGLKIGILSHFEGENYVSAKKGTVCLKYADIRCGNRLAVILNLKGGGISLITPYLPPKELMQLFVGSMTDWKKEVLRHNNY
jgi:hypothetical protein